MPGNFSPPFDNLNDIPPGGLDLDFDGTIDIIPPCSCRNGVIVANGSNSNTGVFDDQLIIATGISGQQWILDDRTNVLRPTTLSIMPVTTPIPEVGNTGVYVLPFAYREGDGYFATARNMANLSQVFGPVTNSCHYPNPIISNLGDFYCDSDPNILMYGEATSGFDGNVTPLIPVNEIWTIQRVENGQVYTGINFSPATLGEGTYKVRYTFDAGSDAHNSPDKTGCSRTVEQQVIVRHSISLSCRSNINLFLNSTTCEAEIIPNLLLTGTYNTLQGLSINVLGGNGDLGDIIPAEYVGQTLTGVVTDECSGSFCTTNINLFDNIAPTLNIPEDTIIACTGSWDPEVTGFAIADDCTLLDLTYEDQWIDNFCFNPSVEILRTWRAVDGSGNATTRIQSIAIERGSDSDFYFPPDLEFSCVAWQADPTITEAVDDKAGIPTLVNEALCKFIYTHSDDTIFLCGNLGNNFIILREWLVINDCTNFIYQTDAAGNDKVQMITVRDNTPPIITHEPAIVVATESPQTNGLADCSSLGLIPPPQVEDHCSEFTLKIFTEIGEVEYVNGVDGFDGGYIPAPGLTLGDHQVTYEATDVCGAVSTQQGIVRVIDELPPVMICNNQLSLTLQSNGYGLIRTTDIDEGSRDDCCLDRVQIKLEVEPDSLFRDTIQIYCDNGIQNVVLRATDCFGNYNECVATVSVRDIIPPQIVQQVSDVTLSCEDDFQNYYDQAFDAPVFSDNCVLTVDFLLEESINDCSIGTITRTWTASDNPDNPPAVVTQVISLQGITNYTLTLPEDMDVYCTEQNYVEMGLDFEGCDMLVTSVTQDTLIEPSAIDCKRIIRHHEVINWCEYDGVSPATVLQRKDGPDFDSAVGDSYQVYSDGSSIYEVLLAGQQLIGPSTGFYKYRQIIRVTDNVPPVVAFSPLASICLDNTNQDCEAAISYAFSTSDDCTPVGQLSVDYALVLNGSEVQVDTYGSLTALGNGNFVIEGNYPAGHHHFRILVSDDCANMLPVNLIFDIEDCQAPTLDCATMMSLQIEDTGQLILTPDLFANMATDNCSEVQLSFSESMNLDTLVLGCNDRGTNIINIWATDNTGNQSTCSLTLEVLDDASNCLSFWSLTGNIANESGEGIENSTVNMTGGQNEQAVTDVFGEYIFQPMPSGNTYQLTPLKDDGHSNGLTTFDLIKITQHILTTQLLDSPYKIIAADANRSGGISTFDILQIRKLILGTVPVFSQNTSWRFVPVDYVFSDPTNPFAEVFPEYVEISDLNADSTINFVGIKVGDVNGSALPGFMADPEERSQGKNLLFKVDDLNLVAGEEYEITFSPEEDQVLGYQFSMAFDPNALTFLSVVQGMDVKEAHFGLNRVGEGLVNLSWNRTAPTQAPAFTLRFLAEESGHLSDFVHISPQGLRAEAYWSTLSDISVGSVEMEFKMEHFDNITVEQNYPNPFSGSTTISFYLPFAETVRFEIRDLNGQSVYQMQKDYPKGRNNIVLEAQLFQKTGIYLYYLTIDHFSDTKKLLFLDK
ncbi:MAG: hypothetical protein DHS20C18_19430 [Saprospiraceae bacterium]|nr:MAG: hypothetical protein DHS20C18_19430 [Saprospiraceae bacterium]